MSVEPIPTGFGKRREPKVMEDRHPLYRTKRWQRLRQTRISQNPVCQLCDNAPTYAVDHLDNDQLNNRYDNLICLCESCHNWKTGAVDMGLVGSMHQTVRSQFDYQRMMLDLRLADKTDYALRELPEMRFHIVKALYTRTRSDGTDI